METAALFNKKDNSRYKLGQAICKIGRDATNHISLASDRYSSRCHARVVCIKGNYWVEDLGSSNGTLLNNEVITERVQLCPGDCLKIGSTELVFEVA